MKQKPIFLSKELTISKDVAILFLLVGVPKMVTQDGVQVVNGAVEIAKILPHLKAIHDAMKQGASFFQAAASINKVFQGGTLSVAARVAGKTLRLTLTVTAAAKVLGSLGAVVGVADAIYSWLTKNPNRKSAEELLPNLKEKLESLKDTKERFLLIQNMWE